MEQERILVVDDDEGLLHLLKMRLSAMGFSVTPCTEGQTRSWLPAKNRLISHH